MASQPFIKIFLYLDYLTIWNERPAKYANHAFPISLLLCSNNPAYCHRRPYYRQIQNACQQVLQ